MVKGGGRRKKCHNEGKKKYVAEEKEKAKKGINTKWYIMKRENKNWEINMETIQRWSRAQSHKHSGPWRGEWYWKLVCWLICWGHSNGPPKLTPGTANMSPCVVKETLQVQLSVWALRWRDVRVIYQGPEEQQEFSFVQPSVQPPGRGGRGGQIKNRVPEPGEKDTRRH